MSDRKIISISTAGVPPREERHPPYVLWVALCDDGSVWERATEYGGILQEWTRVPAIPGQEPLSDDER